MIARKLKKENPSGTILVSNMKINLKSLGNHIKAKDQNEKDNSFPITTYKFYIDMDETLGDKPAVKPVSIVSILSTLKKRYQPGIKNSLSTSFICRQQRWKWQQARFYTWIQEEKKSIAERNIEKLLAKKTDCYKKRRG